MSTTSHKNRLSGPASPLPPYRIRLSVSASPPLHWFLMFPWKLILLPGSPLPTNPHMDIMKESQPILNSLPTHTSSTVPTPSTCTILQELADLWSPSPIVSTCQFHGNKTMNMTSLMNITSAMGVGRHNHCATIFSCISDFTIDWFPLPQSRTVAGSIC